MTPARLVWWSRILRVKTPIADASDLRTRLVARAIWFLLLLSAVPAFLVVAGFVVALIHDAGAWVAGPSPLEARMHALEVQVAAMRDGGHR